MEFESRSHETMKARIEQLVFSEPGYPHVAEFPEQERTHSDEDSRMLVLEGVPGDRAGCRSLEAFGWREVQH